MGVLLVPTLLTGTWLAVLGGNALHLELSGKADMVTAVSQDIAGAIYHYSMDLRFLIRQGLFSPSS